jgi:hypothetical protein
MVAYTNDLRLSELATGEGSGSWGNTTNTNLELIAEAFSFGTEAITTNADTHTTTIADGSTDPGRSIFLKYTGTLDSTCTITIGPNTVSKLWFIENATSGSQSIIISQGSGASITILNGQTKAIYSDGAGSGAAMVDAFTDLAAASLFVDGDLASNTAGTSNFRAGVNAGNSITSGGNYNVVVGDEAGTAITTGDNNVAVGYAALDAEDTGTDSVAIGYNALTAQNNDAANYNVAVGSSAGAAVSSGTANTIIGGLAGDALTTGSNNVAIGLSALSTDDVGSRSVAVGSNALESQNTATAANVYNTAVGYGAGAAVTTGIQNTIGGWWSSRGCSYGC